MTVDVLQADEDAAAKAKAEASEAAAKDIEKTATTTASDAAASSTPKVYIRVQIVEVVRSRRHFVRTVQNFAERRLPVPD